jgi:hypothetical protein
MANNNATIPVQEGNITFIFHNPWEKFDEKSYNGLKLVDFVVEDESCLYFIEIKDYDHPNTPDEQRESNYKMLNDPEAALPLEIGMKLKDSLLRFYALSREFSTEVKFLFIINSNELKSRERTKLAERIAGYIPNGLNTDEHPNFSKISFEMPPIESVKEKYGFDCSITQ